MKQTQGRLLISHLKRKAMTSMQLQMLGISTCWHKRVRERLREDEKLISGIVDGPQYGKRQVKRYTVVKP